MQVRVKHLIEFLQSIDPETEVMLDKDGWMEDEFLATDEVDLVRSRGLFHLFKHGNKQTLIINN
jgi:hypothetical protein